MIFGPVPDSSASPRTQTLFVAAALAVLFLFGRLTPSFVRKQSRGLTFLLLIGLSLALAVFVYICLKH